ncbi:MAG: tetratricopeptide repeat protein, partial [Acidobacteriota bacterium]
MSHNEHSAEAAAEIAAGGFHAVAGSPPAVRHWAEEVAAAADREVLRVDLEGWEPEADDLEGFLDLRAGADGFEAAAEVIEAAAETPCGLFAAAGVSLFCGRSLTSTRDELAAELEKRSAAAPLLVLMDDGDTVPEPLRRMLRELAGARLTVVDGTRSRRPAAVEVGAPRRGDAAARVAEIDDVRARRVLEALAILGRPFPLEPLLELLVDRAEHEETIDLVDDLLDEELGLVEDLGFIHPNFSHSLYRLTDPLWAESLVSTMDVKPRAEANLAFLRRRLEPVARTTTLVLARLVDLVDGGEQARRLEMRLRWWAPAPELLDDLAAAFHAGEIEDSELTRLGADGVLSPAIRLAVIDLHQSLEVSPELEGSVWLHRARALRDGGRLPEAVQAAVRSLEWHELNRGRHEDALLETRLTAGRLMLEARQARAARDLLLAARGQAAEVLDPEDPRHGVLASELGRSLMALGELRAAREPLEEALRRAEGRFGEGHPNAVAACNNLAALLIDIGELEDARERLVQAVRSAKQAGLPIALRIGLWNNLSVVTSRLGDGGDAERLLKEFTAQIAGESTELG